MIRRLGRLALGVAVAVVLFLATGEVLARTLGILDRLNGYGRQLFVRGPSADLPYRLQPGLDTTLFGIHVRVNRLGFRGPEIVTVPPEGTQRVLFLGDSVVFGQGVAEEETMSAELARRLSAHGSYEVVNAGAQGYDTPAEAQLLELVGVALRPRIVVVGMSLNDYDPAPVYDPTGVLMRRPLDERAPRLLDRSEFLLVLRWVVAYARGHTYTQLLERAGRQADAPDTERERMRGLDKWVATEHLRFYRNPDPVLMARLRTGLADLRRLCDGTGARLLVAVFPESYQVDSATPDLTPQQKLLAVCAEVGVQCLDLQPPFAAAGGDLFMDAQHPNARGHAVAATAIAAAILAERDGSGAR